MRRGWKRSGNLYVVAKNRPFFFLHSLRKSQINRSMYPVAMSMSQFGQKIIRFTVIS